MRSIEVLVRQYPNKCGSEILEIYAADIAADKRSYEKQNKKTIKFIEDINTNGGYYRGTFGESQYYYYNFTNLILENNQVRGDCEKIVCFKKGNISDGISIEKRTKSFPDISTYSLSCEERITKKEFDEISKYIDEMFEKFW